MSRDVCAVLVLLITPVFCGCAQPATSFEDDYWVGVRPDGYPNWVVASEIPEELGINVPLPRPADVTAVRQSEDGAPLCYVRLAALVVPSACFDAANGDASSFVARFESDPKAWSPSHDMPCDDDRAIKVLVNVGLRLPEDRGATFSEEVWDEVRAGKGTLVTAEPHKLDESGCTIIYAMQGVVDWTPADRATASWHSAATVRLATEQSHAQWATQRSGDHHILTLARLERITHGEKWAHRPPSMDGVRSALRR